MQTLILVGLFIVGAILASFITVISERIYTGQSWFKGRSRCNSCRRTLTGLDLVPILSWVSSGGRCRTCKVRVPASYTLTEALLGTTFTFSYIHFAATPAFFVMLVLLCVLTFVVLYDIRHTIVPLWASLTIVVLGACVGYLSSSPRVFLHHGLIAICIAFGFFLFYALSRGRAMGLGDTPIALGLSLMAGSSAVPGLFFSFWIGGVVGILILAVRRGGPKMGIEVPFVPFMAAGFLLALFTQWNPLLF